MTIDNDVFPELNHELIKPLQTIDDIVLWRLWQQNPSQARYLIILFYRYVNLTEYIDDGLNKIEINQEYFERLWFFIIDQLLKYKISEKTNLPDVLLDLSQQFFNNEKLIISQIYQDNDDSKIRYLPFKYYLQKSLDKLSPIERIIVVTKDKFAWEEDKILQYLQLKNNITLPEIRAYYTQAHSRLLNNLPTDIISIYLQND
ncbi:hypothetical protein [Geminocystis sp. GBBB08]|uniref:hypothetical protein n=1 Tax=Geminocystis sp. GBBB08 TaxID=2604140 RepID=UPI0027E31EDE|nr:hypothetical protein [Geminocystis sp. GBBB08]MBL1209402.1 hypothetical protein [Geminocystis sp. GBBB08]